MIIGQGSLTATPLQMAVAYATLVNGGTFYEPRVLDQVTNIDGEVVFTNLPNVVRTIDIAPITVENLKEDLNAVVAGPRGTSRTAFSEFCGSDVRAINCESLKQVGGKTGTAEIRVAVTEDDKEVDTAWFVGVAPLDDPRFVVVIVIEEGGSGGGVAAPTTRAILQFLMGETVTPIRSGGEDTE